MKHCPQCDFLYEDDQSVCDMDGARLVHDDRRLAQQPGFIIDPLNAVQPSKNSRWLVLLFAGIVIALVSFVAYLASSRVFSSSVQIPAAEASPPPLKSKTSAPQSTPQPITAPPTETPRLNKPVASVSTSRASATSPAAETTNRAKMSQARVVTERPRTRPNLPPGKADEPDQKTESKIGSFLKKTGRILKKPFER